MVYGKTENALVHLPAFALQQNSANGGSRTSAWLPPIRAAARAIAGHGSCALDSPRLTISAHWEGVRNPSFAYGSRVADCQSAALPIRLESPTLDLMLSTPTSSN